MLRPTQRASWIGYAMSFHLLEDYKNALSILDTFLDQQQVSNIILYYYEMLLFVMKVNDHCLCYFKDKQYLQLK